MSRAPFSRERLRRSIKPSLSHHLGKNYLVPSHSLDDLDRGSICVSLFASMCAIRDSPRVLCEGHIQDPFSLMK